jgi:CMP/dCMP kinase
MIITIDGPAVSGKSSVAKKIAKKLGIYYLYTGLLYRALAFLIMEKYGDLFFHEFDIKLKKYFNEVSELVAKIRYKYLNGQSVITFNENNIILKLFNKKIDHYASCIAENVHVRDILLVLQRELAKNFDCVVDGRDCGSVVFPHAEHKFFLTAAVDERAKRLYASKCRNSEKLNLQKIKENIIERDERDEQRSVAPLLVPKGAIVVDNSKMDIDETVNYMLRCIKKN